MVCIAVSPLVSSFLYSSLKSNKPFLIYFVLSSSFLFGKLYLSSFLITKLFTPIFAEVAWSQKNAAFDGAHRSNKHFLYFYGEMPQDSLRAKKSSRWPFLFIQGRFSYRGWFARAM
jgi:hypothetical protein